MDDNLRLRINHNLNLVLVGLNESGYVDVLPLINHYLKT